MTIETLAQAGALAAPGALLGGDGSVAAVEAWAKKFEVYGKLARGLVRSAFVPQSFRVNLPRNADPEEVRDAWLVVEANATGAMMLGGAIGLDPMTSLQNIFLIHGRPGMYAKIKTALAQAAGHDIWQEEYSATKVVVCGLRKGQPEQRTVRIELTIQDAKDAGWYDSNPNYKKTPADMLYARASGRVADRVASDLLHGIVTVEEIQDLETADDHVRTITRVMAKDVATPAAAAPAIEPQAKTVAARTDAPVEKTADVSAAVSLITMTQSKRLGSLLRKLGVSVVADQMALATALAGHTVTQPGDLTEAETKPILLTLDELTRLTPGAQQTRIAELLSRNTPAPVNSEAEAEPDLEPGPGERYYSPDVQVEDPPGWTSDSQLPIDGPATGADGGDRDE